MASRKSRSRDRLDERSAEILKIATRMFAEKGFRNTDVQDIADEAGVGKGTVYRRFGTKKGLFLAAVDRGVSELVESVLEKIGAFTDPVKRMEVGLEAYLDFFDKHKDLVEVFIQERSEFRGRGKATYFAYRDNNISVVEDMLKQGIKRGIFRPINVRHTAEILADTAYGTVVTHLMRGGRGQLASRARDILDVHLNGIRRHRGGRSSSQ